MSIYLIAIVEIKTGGELSVFLDDKSDPHWEAHSQVSQKNESNLTSSPQGFNDVRMIA